MEFKSYRQHLLCDWLIFNHTSCFRINKQMFIGFSIREKKINISLTNSKDKRQQLSQLYFLKKLEKFLAKTLNRTVLWSVRIPTDDQCFSVIFVSTPRAIYLFSVSALLSKRYIFGRRAKVRKIFHLRLIFWNRNAPHWLKLFWFAKSKSYKS